MAIAIVGCAIAVTFVLSHVAQPYVPFDQARFAPLMFVHYRLPHARLGLREIAGALVIWSAALFVILGALRRSSRSERIVPAMVAAQAVLLAIVFVSPLPLDSDQYAYVGIGAAVKSHANPYEPVPLPAGASIVRERVAAHWGNPLGRDVYGPLFTLADGTVLRPFRNMSVEAQSRVLRLLAALAALACSLLIAGIVRDERWREIAVAAFALNPLVVVETANGAHNDIFMVACALGAAYLLRRDAFVAAGFLLGCAIAIKFAYAPLILPFAAYVYVRARNVSSVVGSLISIAVPIAATAALYGLWRSLVTPLATRRVDVLDHLPFLHRLGPRVTFDILAAAIGLCAVLAAAQILRRNLAAASGTLIALLLLTWLFADKIEPWYAIMLTPLVLLVGYGGVAIFAAFSTAALVMLSGAFLDVFPTTLTLAVAAMLVLVVRYAVAEKSGTSLTTTLRPRSLPS